MIPKTIHYCWFGGTPLPESACKCIDSWKKFFPEYEIKEWNESNFDVNCCAYVQEAYEAKKWAFVSDYARYWILFHHGGLYFDTDVEVIRSFTDILCKGPFMGKEADRGNLVVNPGLCMGAEKKMTIYKAVLDYYSDLHFDPEHIITVVQYTTELLRKEGYEGTVELERVCGMNLYPPQYFSPKDYYTGEMHITEETHSIHHYDNSWSSKKSREFFELEKRLKKVLGENISECILIKLFRVIYTEGFIRAIKKTFLKIRGR